MKILIKDLVLYGYHGVREQEKENGQNFIFNIIIYIKDEILRNDDKLESTLNYSDVIKEIKKINKSKRCDLLETLSHIIADCIMNMSSLVEKIDVRIEKPSPPIDEKLGSVGVEYSISGSKSVVFKGDRVFLSLGSNMGNRMENINMAMSILRDDPCIEVIKTSSFYETEPLYEKDQGYFYNITAEIRTGGNMDPFRLLGIIKSIEYKMGRVRDGKRYGPRPIDIDILYFGDEKIKSEILQIPHPLIGERKFVLVPLVEIAPDLRIENMHIKTYLEKKKLAGRVKKLL